MGSNLTKDRQAFEMAAKACLTKLPQDVAIILEGESYTPAELSKIFQDAADSIDAAAASTAARAAAIALEKKNIRTGRSVFRRLRASFISSWGNGSILLPPFGMVGRKVTKTTLKNRFKGSEKAIATKKELGVVGKKKRKAAKGGGGNKGGSGTGGA